MEELLDDDFGDVRIHADHEAAEAAAELRADAFTEGHDIYFATGRASFRTSEGAALLAHELTHVRQARRGGGESDSGGTLWSTAGEQEALANEGVLRRHLESREPHRPRAPGPAVDLPILRIQLDDPAASGQSAEAAGRGAIPHSPAPSGVARAPVRRAAEQAPASEGVSPAADGEDGAPPGSEDVNVDALASQVYEMIMRRLTLERERIGFH